MAASAASAQDAFNQPSRMPSSRSFSLPLFYQRRPIQNRRDQAIGQPEIFPLLLKRRDTAERNRNVPAASQEKPRVPATIALSRALFSRDFEPSQEDVGSQKRQGQSKDYSCRCVLTLPAHAPVL
jgi:hypothetical protein